MEGRRSLGNLLAVAAGELLAHMRDDLPLPRNDLQLLGHVLVEPVQRRSTVARARRRPRKNDALASAAESTVGAYAHESVDLSLSTLADQVGGCVLLRGRRTGKGRRDRFIREKARTALARA